MKRSSALTAAAGVWFSAATVALAAPGLVHAQTIKVEQSIVIDYRPVIARIEAGDPATARSRLQGVVTQLNVVEGQIVKAGDLVAVVTDNTLTPQLSGMSSNIEGLKAQVTQAQKDISRNEGLLARGFHPRARLDEEKTSFDVLKRSLASAQAERRALSARESEGRILAPAAAHVTDVDVVEGSVVSPGDVLASFATVDGAVRLALPDRHAATISEGKAISLRLPSRSDQIRTATIIKIYPELKQGSVIADAKEGGLTALSGERVDVLAAMIGAAVILTDPIFQGLAISLLFGLASSTALTVLVFPAIYIALRSPEWLPALPAPEKMVPDIGETPPNATQV